LFTIQEPLNIRRQKKIQTKKKIKNIARGQDVPKTLVASKMGDFDSYTTSSRKRRETTHASE
jgi:hypothetical protein